MRRDIRIERVLPHPREHVWRALTERERLSSWLMPTEDFAPIVGQAFTFRMKPQAGWDGITHCVVTDVAPGRRIAYAYRGRARGDKPIACAGVESERVRALGRGVFAELDTLVCFALEDDERGTRLVLEQRGFTGALLVVVGLVMDWGWRRMLDRRLPRALDACEHTPST